MLRRVTLTGVDNKTNIYDLVKLKLDFPFVEFGVLISANNTNLGKNNRYPDLKVIQELKGKGLDLACHICGSIARDIVLRNDWNSLVNLLGNTTNIFDRFQLNVSGLHKFSENIQFPKDSTFIIQFKEDTSFYDYYKDRVNNVQGFQDNSGGLGIFENNWMVSDRYMGYAGGLSAENVESVLESFRFSFMHDYWIDMESSIRTNDWLDLKKCREVLSICERFVG